MFSVKASDIQLNFPSKWYDSLSPQIHTLGVVGNACPAPAKLLRPPDGRKLPSQHPRIASLPCGLHMSLGDWPAGIALGFLSGPHLELAVGANLCPCCKWCMSSLGHPPSCLPGISLWYLLPRKKGERWRTTLGQNAYSLRGALREAPAFSTGCWGYKKEEKEHGETYHMLYSLWENFKFISAPLTHMSYSPLTHLTFPCCMSLHFVP